MEINYTPSKAAEGFIQSTATVKAIQGPIAGGKTTACIMEIFKQCQEAGVSTRWGVLWANHGTIRSIIRAFEDQVKEKADYRHNKIQIQVNLGRCIHEIWFYAEDHPDHMNWLLRTDFTGVFAVASSGLSVDAMSRAASRILRYPIGMNIGSLLIETLLPDRGSELEEYLDSAQVDVHKMPSGLSPSAENVANLCPRYYERLAEGKSQEWVDKYIRAEWSKM